MSKQPIVGTQFNDETVAAIDRYARDLTRQRGTRVKRSTAIRELVHARLLEAGYLADRTDDKQAA